MKQIEVRIMGQTYLLGCAEGAEKDLLEAVQMIDMEMCNIRDSGKVRALERIAVLAALNIAVNTIQNAPKPQNNILPPFTNNNIATPSIDCEDLIVRIDNALSTDGHLL